MSRHPKQDLMAVPVIRVDMEPPMGHVYWLSEQERLEANNGVYNFFARKAGAYKNSLDPKEYTLISRVFDQYPLTEKMIDTKRNDAGPADASRVFDYKAINSLQELLVRVVGLQEYFMHKKSGPINPSLKWNSNTQSLPAPPSGPAPQTLIALIQYFKHAYAEFNRTILEDAKLNKTTEIIKQTHDVIISAFNIQNYFLLLQGRKPFWYNANYTSRTTVNHAAQYEFQDLNPPPPPPESQVFLHPDLVTIRPKPPGVPNPYPVPHPMQPLPIPSQDPHYVPMQPNAAPAVNPGGQNPNVLPEHWDSDPNYDGGYVTHAWYSTQRPRLIRPSRYWRY
jgi:hypothetical protein